MKTMMALVLMSGAALAGDGTREDALRKLQTMKVSLDFQDVKFSEAMDYLRDVTGVNLVLSPKVGDVDAKVRLKVRDLTVKSALKLLLSPRGLSATWKDGAVVILPQEDLQEDVTLRMYDVRAQMVKLQDFPGPKVELVTPNGNSIGPMIGVDLIEPRDPPIAEDSLVDLIKENTGGRSWEGNTKTAISLANGMLVVSQSAAVHREIQALLGRLAGYR